MKKVLIILLVVVMAASLFLFAGCKEKDSKEKLYVYTESAFAPFEYLKGGEVVGVDIEIAKAIAEALNMELVIKDVDFEAVLAGITDDNSIALAGITITELRSKTVDFSIPYYGDAIQYVIYKDGALTIDDEYLVSADQLKNKKLGVQTGTTGDILATEESAAEKLFAGATVRQYSSALVATQDIGSGCDYVIIDRLTALQIVSENPGLKANQIADLEAEEYGIAVKKGNYRLLNAINWVLHNLMEEGKIAEWLEEHSASIEE